MREAGVEPMVSVVGKRPSETEVVAVPVRTEVRPRPAVVGDAEQFARARGSRVLPELEGMGPLP